MLQLINILATKFTDLQRSHDIAIGERDIAIDERDTAIGERDTAINERNTAINERDHVFSEITEVLHNLTLSQRTSHQRTALPSRVASTLAPPTPPRSALPPTTPRSALPPTPPRSALPPTPPRSALPPTPPRSAFQQQLGTRSNDSVNHESYIQAAYNGDVIMPLDGCLVCMEDYTSSLIVRRVLIPCGHELCSACLARIVPTRHGGVTCVCCPQCRRPVDGFESS